ncbi:MAG: hypothetical protein FWH36_00460 [Lentimicrobiaceae bacterium]|nr:hypothetical protein [Lentimicrobiaceae bacterium]
MHLREFISRKKEISSLKEIQSFQGENLFTPFCRKFAALCFCFLSISIHLFSQKGSAFLHKHQPQDYHYVDTDTARIYYTDNIPNLIIFNLPKEDEYFLISDTSQRDFIFLDGKKYLVDSLCFINYNDYAMHFVYTGTYHIVHKQAEYLIITGADGFLMGTMVQPIYLVFQKKGNEYHFLSSYYIEDIGYYDEKILNSVKIIKKRDKIILKGINLKCVHGFAANNQINKKSVSLQVGNKKYTKC